MKKIAARKKTPVTVITGYLGAGKTSLLRNLLAYAQRQKMRLAIVMNEFGQVGIDGKLVKGKNIELVELSGGCVCCSMSGEFEAALKELMKKASPDHIVIETTGVAEPDSIVVDLGNIPGVFLDAVVTVADGDSLARFPTLGNTGRMQLEMADLILLNKADLVKKQELAQVKRGIIELNSRAAIVECVRCQVAPEMVLGVGGAAEKKPKSHSGKEHDHSQNEFFSLDAPKANARKEFESFVKTLPSQIYRAKGFVKLIEGKKGSAKEKTQGKPKLFLWNYVAGRSELEAWQGKEKAQLVFIGLNALKVKKYVSAKFLELCK